MDRPHLFYVHLDHDQAWLHMRKEGRRIVVANAASMIGWFLAARDYRGEFWLVRSTTAPTWW